MQAGRAGGRGSSQTDKLDDVVVASMAADDDKTCGICLEDSKDPLNLPCGHSFCDGCLGEWRSRYGVEEEMRRKCPICRAKIPPSKEMVSMLLSYRVQKQKMEDDNNTSPNYSVICQLLERAEERIGRDWDGVTVLQGDNDKKPAVVMPDYIIVAILGGAIKQVLRWINANRTEDRVNAITSAEYNCVPALVLAGYKNQLALMSLLLQLGADVNIRFSHGTTAIAMMFTAPYFEKGTASSKVRLLLSWGAKFFPESPKEGYIDIAREYGAHELADLVESELGGRRCEIVNVSSRPELNGKTCVADEYLPSSNKYKVALENKTQEVLFLGPDNLKRRDRTPRDCGYYIEFKNGRTIRHDFDSSLDCQAFVAALNSDEIQSVVTEEAEARAEQAAAELLAELGLDDSANESSSGCRSNKSKKKKGGKKKKKKK